MAQRVPLQLLETRQVGADLRLLLRPLAADAA
jgi:diaminohydroxyphosphoribosylaminopyrimidine deaminase/5-amino-6-(5-phosphoribosylamino)uracil reductase